MTPKEKTKEIERICNKINAYYDSKKEEISELKTNIEQIEIEATNTIKFMIDSECEKKNVSKTIVSIILKDANFIGKKVIKNE